MLGDLGIDADAVGLRVEGVDCTFIGQGRYQ